MPDICIFYAREDRQRVEILVKALSWLGWNVWWDKDIHSGNWASHVEKAVGESRCIMPVWTKSSIHTDRVVLNETKHAKDANKEILPVKYDEVPIPLLFNMLHTEDLTRWSGDPTEKPFIDLIESLVSILGAPPKRWSGARPSL